jgi:HEAT repeat protein
LVVGLGGAFPDEFLDQFDRAAVPLANDPILVISALRGVDGPRARTVLCQFAEHPDYIVRSHVINALKWRDDEVATAVVEGHLSDSSALVRLDAIRGVARRNAKRARPLLAAMVHDKSVPPLLRQEARRTLTELDSEDADP